MGRQGKRFRSEACEGLGLNERVGGGERGVQRKTIFHLSIFPFRPSPPTEPVEECLSIIGADIPREPYQAVLCAG